MFLSIIKPWLCHHHHQGRTHSEVNGVKRPYGLQEHKVESPLHPLYEPMTELKVELHCAVREEGRR